MATCLSNVVRAIVWPHLITQEIPKKTDSSFRKSVYTSGYHCMVLYEQSFSEHVLMIFAGAQSEKCCFQRWRSRILASKTVSGKLVPLKIA